MVFRRPASLATAPTAVHAAPTDPFAYKLAITPEDGSINPAIDRRYTPAFKTCQAHAVSTPATAQCFVAEFAKQDAVLNRTWKATLASRPDAEHRPLIDAQRKWVAERDPFCMTESDGYSGGTIAPIIYVSCRVELTIRRTMWLEHLR